MFSASRLSKNGITFVYYYYYFCLLLCADIIYCIMNVFSNQLKYEVVAYNYVFRN